MIKAFQNIFCFLIINFHFSMKFRVPSQSTKWPSLFSFLFPILLCIMLLPSMGLGELNLKVGVLIPFTGRWGDSGRECAKGMLDGVKWLNQRGGVLGSKLELLLIDDTSQPAETLSAYRKLNEADRIFLLYIYSTETGLSLLPHFHFDRIPTLLSFLPSPLAN